MTIVRAIHNSKNPFVMIHKESLWDKNLSLPAVGLWARLLSRPDDWKIKVPELAKSCGCSVKMIYKLLKELIEHGYAEKIQPKVAGSGFFSPVEYVVYEESIGEEKLKKCLPLSQNQLSGKQLSRKRDTTNIDILNTENTNIPPLPPPPKEPDIPPPTKEEEEEIQRRFKERPKNAPRIVSRKKWDEQVLKNIRIDSKAKEVDLNRFQRHKAQAMRHDGRLWPRDPDFRVCACANHVEFTYTSQIKIVGYDVSDEQWKNQTGWINDN